MSRHALLLGSLLVVSSFASAQQAAAPAARPAARPAAAAQQPALTPAQQAQLAKQNAEMSQAALKVAQMVDANQAGQLWDGASVVAKKAVTRDAFVRQIAAERTRLGAVAGRGAGSVTRVKYAAGAQVPEGMYVNISFPTRFANAPQPVRELVSFRLDEDKTWRLAGYSLRTAGN
jgi:ribonuclease HII